MNLISDTNIFLAVALNEPEKDGIIQATAGFDVISPEILLYEIGNALTAMVKRNRLNKEEALSAFESARSIPVKLVSVDVKTRQIIYRFFKEIGMYSAPFFQRLDRRDMPEVLPRNMVIVNSEISHQSFLKLTG